MSSFDLPRRALLAAALCLLVTPAGKAARAEAPPGEPSLPSLDPSRAIHHYVHKVWRADHGLPASAIRDIVQSHDGYLWLATHAGLVRFDGVRFKVFNTANSPGLETNFLTRLCLGRDGTLWIGGEGGLIRFRDGEFSTLARNEGLTGLIVEDLMEASDGSLWVVASGQAHRLEGGRFSVLERPVEVAAGWINDVAEGPQGSMWFTTRDHGLLQWQAGEWHSFTPADGLLQGSLRHAYTDRSGVLWLTGVSRGPWWLVRYRDGRFTGYSKPNGIRAWVRALHESRDGTLWIAAPGGLLRLRDGGFDSLDSASVPPDDRFLAVYEDREGGLWAGTYGGRLHRFSNGPITTYSEPDGLRGTVRAVFEDRDRTLWIGGTEGLYRFGNGRFAPVDEVPESVWAIGQSPGGALWLGTRTALVRQAGGEWTRYPTDRPVFFVYPERDDLVHVSISGVGFSTWTSGDFAAVDGLSNRSVRWIDKDPSGTLWLGTGYSGLGQLREGRLSWLTSADGLSSDALLSFHRDDQGALWIGTEGGGLNRLSGEVITTYSSRDGLHDDSIWPILEDERQNLWMGGDHGIFRVERQALADFDAGRIATVPSVVYGTADGLKTLEGAGMGEPSGWRTSDGRLWFAMVGGVAMIDPKRLGEVPPPPPPLLEEILIDGQEIDRVEELSIPPGARELEIRFTAMSFFKPDRIQLQYRLEGYDRTWRDAGVRRSAFYANLPPRSDYRFQVRARHEGGEWSKSAARLPLVVLPAWWQTWWLRSAAALVVAALVTGAHRLRLRHVARRARETQRQAAELKKAQIELRATEELGRATLDSLSAPVAVLDPQGQILRVNETWRRTGRENGASPELISGVGLNYLDACRNASGASAGDGRRCLAGIESVLDGSSSLFDLEYQCQRSTGGQWFLMRVVPLGSTDRGAVVNHIDITARKLSELAAREDERKLRLVADALPVLIALFDSDQRFLLINGAYRRALGLESTRVEGATLRAAHGEAGYEALRAAVERALAGEETRFQTELPLPTGESRLMEVSFLPNFGAYGHVLGFFSLMQDVTERERSALTVQRQSRELTHLQRAATMGELTGALSHEINQPLTAIRSNTEVALRHVDSGEPDLDEMREILRDIADDDRRASEIIRHLHGLHKKRPVTVRTLDVNEAVAAIVRLTHSDAVIRRVEVVLDLAEGLPPVQGDYVQLQQVLLNLVVNGFDAMEDTPREERRLILRSALADGAHVRLSVQDAGTGFDERDATRMFEAFHTTKPEGMGMGLSITRSIVEAHSGRIWAENNSERGATFHVRLPVAPSKS